MHVPGKDPVALTNDQVIGLIHSQKEEIERLTAQVAYLQTQTQGQGQTQGQTQTQGPATMTITEISETTAAANSEISQDLMKKYEDAIRENLELRMEIDNLKQKIKE